MSYFDFLNEIEGNSPLSPNDKVIYNLSEEETNKYKEIKSEYMELYSLIEKAKKKKDVVNAKWLLFWDALENNSELMETSATRGNIVDIKEKEDGNLVVVETPNDKGFNFRKLF